MDAETVPPLHERLRQAAGFFIEVDPTRQMLLDAAQLIDDLENRKPNAPPLAELLAEELRPYAERAQALLASAAGVTEIHDDETAASVSLLGKQISEWADRGDKDRLERKRPLIDAGKLVDGAYGAFIDPLKAVLPKLRAVASAWLQKKKAEAEAEQRRQMEAARLAQIEANKAAALAAIDNDAGAVAQAAVQTEAASQLVQAAAEAKPVVVQGLAGTKTTGRTIRHVVITDLQMAVNHLVATKPATVLEFVTKEYEAMRRAKVENLPGSKIEEEASASFR